MLLNFMKAKIHRATVTQADLEYEGSITIEQSLLEESGILPYEQVHIYNIDNGQRFSTYTIEGSDEGQICVNGAAARLVSPGDKIIIMAYCQMTPEEASDYCPRVVLMDEENKVKDSFVVKSNRARPAGAGLAERK